MSAHISRTLIFLGAVGRGGIKVSGEVVVGVNAHLRRCRSVYAFQGHRNENECHKPHHREKLPDPQKVKHGCCI